MKIFIATAVSQPWSTELAERFRHLARISRFDAHVLADTPEEADAILFVDLHQFPDDWSLSTLRRHPLVRKHARKVFVYDERDRPWCEWPGIYVSMPRAGFERSRQRAYSYYEIKTEMAPAPASRADLLFSFQGARSHSSREAILQLSHPRGHVEDTSQLNFFDFSEQADTPEYKSRVAAQKARYQEIVARSKFVLCPRGMGNSSFRLYETLASARVPVIISDDWVAPRGPDWSACSLRVPESQIAGIPRLLEERESHFDAMSAHAREVFDEYFAPDVMFHRLAECCQSIANEGETGPRKFYFVSQPFAAAALAHFTSSARVAGGKLKRKIRPRA